MLHIEHLEFELENFVCITRTCPGLIATTQVFLTVCLFRIFDKHKTRSQVELWPVQDNMGGAMTKHPSPFPGC